MIEMQEGEPFRNKENNKSAMANDTRLTLQPKLNGTRSEDQASDPFWSEVWSEVVCSPSRKRVRGFERILAISFCPTSQIRWSLARGSENG